MPHVSVVHVSVVPVCECGISVCAAWECGISMFVGSVGGWVGRQVGMGGRK